MSVLKNDIKQLVGYCKEINLDLIGLMCIPPVNINSEVYFEEMKNLNKALGFLSSAWVCLQISFSRKYQSTFIRVGSYLWSILKYFYFCFFLTNLSKISNSLKQYIHCRFIIFGKMNKIQLPFQ